MIEYTIFETNWGYFGLCATEKGLLRSVLPDYDAKNVENELIRAVLGVKNGEEKENPDFNSTSKAKLLQLKNLGFEHNPRKFVKLAEHICDYFTEGPVMFSGEVIDYSQLSDFTRKVLRACMEIKYGEVTTYGEIAKKAGFPRASRAAGRVLAANRLPLIIPCHRIIRSDGTLGGFSAGAGCDTKALLLAHERKNKP